MTLTSSDTTPQPRDGISLRILQTTDLHGNLRGYDYFADRPNAAVGLSRVATLIAAARTEARNCLLFDSGDFLQGSPICDLIAQTGLAPGACHPVIAAMNALRYDAATPGNHDFNHGAEFLLRALQQAAFPVVSANMLRRATGTHAKAQPLFAPHTLLDRVLTDTAGRPHRLGIGVIGCLPPQTTEWDHHLSDRLETRDIVPSVRASVAALRALGADLIVVLAHTGLEDPADRPGLENAGIPIAAIDGVDVVLAGHTHDVFPGPRRFDDPAVDSARGLIHGTPVVMPGFWGNHLGQVDLTLQPAASGGWQVAQASARALPLVTRDSDGRVAPTVPEDPALCTVTRHAHTDTIHHIRRPVGQTEVALHSFFSLVANDASVQLVARAQAEYIARALKDTEYGALPLLSAAAPFKTGHRAGPDHYTHVPPGPMTLRSIADLYHYPNRICAVQVSGLQLRHWLEHSASQFSQLTPTGGPDQPLLNDSFPGYQFDVLQGLRYRIDLSLPARFDGKGNLLDLAARRIADLSWQGEPVSDTMHFIVATNSYRAHGFGLGSTETITALPLPDVVFESPKTVRDILSDHVRRHSPITTPVEPNWGFEPLAGRSAWFETSPLARRYLDRPDLPQITDLGDTCEGFARFRITL